MNHENEIFSYNCRKAKCKNHVNNASKDVTPTSPNKNKLTRTGSTLYKPFHYNNTDEDDNGLNTSSDSITVLLPIKLIKLIPMNLLKVSMY